MLHKPLFRRADDLDEFVDLASVPRHRYIHNHPFVLRLRRAVEFDYVSISGLDIDRFRFGTGQSVDTDFPPAFIEAYYEARFHLTDPYVMASKNARDVVVEADVPKPEVPNERLNYLLETFNIKNRTLFPIRRGDVVYGGVGFTRSYPFDAEEIAFLKEVAPAAHNAITGRLMRRFAASELRLSTGEVLCLRLASRGLTSEQIALESGYQVDTVNTYIKNATKKVGASNRTQAIAEAIRRGLID
ncbi:LuxR C-terminal-related transcriptional regulator [Rhizobium helianthi]|uniref:LuxR C-terminal-related transcriptional regulator n=1 Tax=Rhizobium helianthi TaxID=1132695 RepID=A0ABW4M832_9HYPH